MIKSSLLISMNYRVMDSFPVLDFLFIISIPRMQLAFITYSGIITVKQVIFKSELKINLIKSN